MLLDQLKHDLMESLKRGEGTRVETLRFLLSGIHNFAIAQYGSAAETSLTDEDVQNVIKKQVKTHRESIEAFEKGGRGDLVDREKAQLSILEAFLPKAISDEELRALLEPVVASGETNFGLLMKNAMAVVGQQAEGGRVAVLLKEMLTNIADQRGVNADNTQKADSA